MPADPHPRKGPTVRSAIIVDRLTKTYPGQTALDPAFYALGAVSFVVPERTTFALLGRPGTGKTTVIGCLSTRITPTSGTVQVGRHVVSVDDRRIRREVGVVAQESQFDPARTVWENLLLSAERQGYSGRSVQRRIEQLCGVLEIMSVLDRRFGNLPVGFRRRADIVGALVHDPSIVLLDEPTAGLDSDAHDGMWDALRRLTVDLGLTTVLTTRDETDADRADVTFDLSADPAAAARNAAAAQDIAHPVTPEREQAAVQQVGEAEHTGDELRLLLHDPTALSLIASYDITARGDIWVLPVRDWAEARDVLRMLDGAITDFDFVPGTTQVPTGSRERAASGSVGRHSHLRAVTA
ncbi:ATP-binding cassette domain-containing protein [Brevibacterium yomogidense]|uniref:ATP-binding cassette domain-containing protein n=1 Tax=Brevibacterium yomogidense TaxID=946573 RepID=UPI0018DF832C